MRAGRVAGQRQAEADAGRILGARFVQPGEGAEGVLMLVFRNAGAIIVDVNLGGMRPVHQCNLDRVAEFHGI